MHHCYTWVSANERICVQNAQLRKVIDRCRLTPWLRNKRSHFKFNILEYLNCNNYHRYYAKTLTWKWPVIEPTSPSNFRTSSGVKWRWKNDSVCGPVGRALLALAMLVGIRLALLHGSLPAFSPQDNPPAFHQSFVVR